MRLYVLTPDFTRYVAEASSIKEALATVAWDGLALAWSDGMPGSDGSAPSPLTVVDRDNPVEPAEPVTLVAYAANARWEREVAGTMWNGWPIYTDDRAQIKYLAELAAIEAGVRVDGEPWKFADGLPRPLTNIQMRNLAIAARSYVTSTFKLEFMALAQIAAGTATTTADVDAILGGAL